MAVKSMTQQAARPSRMKKFWDSISIIFDS